MAHTKGEWKVTDRWGNTVIETTGFNLSGSTIATLNDKNDNHKDDAAFICKAVNNYDAVIDVLENIVFNIDEKTEDGNWLHSLKSCTLTDYQCNEIQSLLKKLKDA